MTELNAEANNGVVNGAATHEVNGEAEVLHFPRLETDAAAASSQVKRPVRSATHGAGVPQSTNARKLRVVDIRKNQTDCRGEPIDFVFFRRAQYAIYSSNGRIMVHYADDDTVAKTQSANIADLLPLRDRLQYLVGGLEDSHSNEWQIAESLRLGLEGQKDAAKTTMQTAIDHINAMRMRKGRITYLVAALITTAVLLSWDAGAAIVWKSSLDVLSDLMLATGSGAIGALLFMAIALRARTVATDGDLISNFVDSAVRILIGVICAGVLYLLLATNVLSLFTIGGKTLTESDITWQIAVLIGFAAGYLERLVPDLLEKKLAPATK